MIMTDVPFVAEEVKERRAGLVIPYEESNLTNTLIALLKDEANFLFSIYKNLQRSNVETSNPKLINLITHMHFFNFYFFFPE